MIRVDPTPRRIPLAKLFLWPGNPRIVPLGDFRDIEDVAHIADEQTAVEQALKHDEAAYFLELKQSIGSLGFVANARPPIAVSALQSGEFLVVDGNIRVLALRELLADEQWCRRHQSQVQVLKDFLPVSYFGRWDDEDDRLAVLAHTLHVHSPPNEN